MHFKIQALLSGAMCATKRLGWALPLLAYSLAGNAFGQVQFQWASQFGASTGGQVDLGTAAAAANGFYYVAGSTVTSFPGQPSYGGWDVLVRQYDGGGNVVWTRQIGSNNTDWAYGVAADASGNVYVTGQACGTFSGQVALGSCDAFLAKLNASGTLVWVRQFGTAASDIAYAVAIDSNGNPSVTGATQGAFPTFTNAGANDVFVRKYDGNGNVIFTDQVGSTGSDEGRTITVNTADEILVGGWMPGGFFRKYSPAGAAQWTVFPGAQQVHGLSYAPDGTFYAAVYSGGGVVRKYDALGGQLWSASLLASPFAVSADANGVSVAGSTNSTLPGQTSSGGQDAFARRYSPTGAEVWTQQFGTLQSDEALGVAVDATGTFLGGTTRGVFPGQPTAYGVGDIFSRKYDPNGLASWTDQFGGLWPGYSSALAVDVKSSVYTAGYTTGPLPGNSQSGSEDAFVSRHDLSGSLIWLRQFGTGGVDYARAVVADASGNVYVGGNTNGALPGKTRTGSEDGFLRKLDPNGNELWTVQFGVNGSSETRLQNAAIDAAGNVITLGVTTFALPGQTNTGSMDCFLRVYDPNGNVLWTRQFGTPGYDYGFDLALGVAGQIYVSGYTQGAFPGFTKVGSDDAFVAAFDATGTLQWAHQFGAASGTFTRAFGLAAAADGSVYTVGHTGASLAGQPYLGQLDAFIRKLSPLGSALWTKQYGTAVQDEARGVAIDALGNIVVGATTGTGIVPNYFNLWVLTPGGDSISQTQYHGMNSPASSTTQAFTIDTVGGSYFAGYTNGALPGQTKTPGASADAMLVKFQVTNSSPTVTVTQSAVTAAEGSSATNGGSFSDLDAADNIALTASVGLVSKTGANAGTWSWSLPAADGPAGPQTVTVQASDGKGGVAMVSFTVTVVNIAPGVTISVTPALDEGQPAVLAGTITDPGALDSHVVTINWGDGTTSSQALGAGVLGFAATHTYADDNPSGTASDVFSVSVVVTDKDGGTGAASANLTVNNIAPSLGAVVGPHGPLPVGTSVTLSAPVSDLGSLDILQCRFSWDDGTPDTVAAPSSGTCSATHLYAVAGVYSPVITVSDDDAGSSRLTFEYVVVFDPTAGFVTGGGWILSPAGAYLPDPAVSGKSHFGFVSRYQKGASTPSGQTEFQFQSAGFRFNSTTYDWLVVAGARAQYKGDGSVNGVPGYAFLLTAIDGQVNGGGGVDKFRIKIWKKATAANAEVLVYDNAVGSPDDLDQAYPQAIGGGNITVHKD